MIEISLNPDQYREICRGRTSAIVLKKARWQRVETVVSIVESKREGPTGRRAKVKVRKVSYTHVEEGWALIHYRLLERTTAQGVWVAVTDES